MKPWYVRCFRASPVSASYFAEQALQRVKLEDSLQRRVPELLALMDGDRRINVARLHQASYPDGPGRGYGKPGDAAARYALMPCPSVP